MQLLTTHTLLTALVIAAIGAMAPQLARAQTATTTVPLTYRVDAGDTVLQPVGYRYRAHRHHRFGSHGYYQRPYWAGRYYGYPRYYRYGYYPRHFRRHGRSHPYYYRYRY